jgi:hypothetical protein
LTTKAAISLRVTEGASLRRPAPAYGLLDDETSDAGSTSSYYPSRRQQPAALSALIETLSSVGSRRFGVPGLATRTPEADTWLQATELS